MHLDYSVKSGGPIGHSNPVGGSWVIVARGDGVGLIFLDRLLACISHEVLQSE